MKQLTQKQEQFALNLFQGMTQRESWVKAGYSSKYAPALIDIHACQLANSDKIKVRLAELRKKAEDAAITTVVERKKILSEIERARLSDFVDESGNITLKPSSAIAEIVIEDWKGGKDERASSQTKRIKLRDPVGAMAEHNKMERVYEPDKSGDTYNQYNIIVASKAGEELVKRLMSGERPQIVEGEISH